MKLLLPFFFVFIFIIIHSQYTSTWYNLDNGLPQNSVKDIVKDKYGFIWLSTEGGIVKYDGLNFTTYNGLPSSKLRFDNFKGNIAQNEIISLNNYEESQLLIKDRSVKAIIKNTSYQPSHDKGKILNKRIAKSSPATTFFNDIQYYIETSTGKYLFYNKETIYYDKVKKTTLKLPIHIKQDDLPNLFVLGQALILRNLTEKKVYKIYNGKITALAQPGLLNDPDTKIFWHQLNNQAFIINKSNIYYASQNCKDEPELKFLVYYKSIENSQFNTIFYDENSDRLYMGSITKGLNILQLSNFYNSQKKTPFADNSQYASLPFSQSTIIDVYGNVLNPQGVVKQFGFKNIERYQMAYDNSKNILSVNDNYLLRRTKFSGYKAGDTIAFTGKVTNIFKDSSFYAISLKYSTYSLLHLFQDDKFKKPLYTIRFKGNVNSFLRYTTDELLIGCSNGLFFFSQRTKKITVIAADISVKSIISTEDGQIWITTTDDGLYLIKNKKAVKMPLDKNSYLKQAHYILYDPSGNYWISSNNGLFRIAKKHLLEASKNNSPYAYYYRFSKWDGLSTNEFNGGSSPNAYCLENKFFVFPSIEGMVFFDPLSTKVHYPNKKDIYIERFRTASGKIIFFKDQITLESNYNLADILIDIPYYADPENLIIEAKTEDQKDSTWKRIRNERELRITGLAPGNHIIKFRILTSSQGKYEYRSVKINILPLFYETSLFKIAMLILILGLIGAIIDIKTKKLRKKVYLINSELRETSINLRKAEKNIIQEAEYQKKLIEAIGHDIATPVKFISLLSQKFDSSSDTETQKKYFESIYKASEELYKFTFNLKEYNDLYKIQDPTEREAYFIREILETKRKLFNEIAQHKGNTIIIVLPDEDIKCQINKNILSCIIHNLTDNAIKNTTNGSIQLSVQKKEDKIIINISDSGSGMSNEQIDYYNRNANNENITFKNYGHGLHMVIPLVKRINAKIVFSPNEPHGTEVRIILKNNIYK